jgi:16S rRNA (uracil1498-N3)-methyltransferase
VFLPGAVFGDVIELPPKESDKFRKVLRMQDGDQILVLPNDGTGIRCELQGPNAVPLQVEHPDPEPKIQVTNIQALPKGERLETVLRMGTEIGVSKFVVFPAIRSIVQWDQKKIPEKFRRLEAICREAAEQSYRSIIPTLQWENSLQSVLKAFPEALVLSEMESEAKTLSDALSRPENSEAVSFVVGPEGGWAPKELALIGDRGVTMGPRVLRTDTAGLAAASLALFK